MSLPSQALEIIRAERAAVVLQVLSCHVGRAHGLHERELVARTLINGREIRKAIESLRLDGTHICGKPDIGYYIAATPDELAETITFLEKRATKTFRQLAAMKKIGMAALYHQMSLRESAAPA
jgi:biotin operon repressor